VAALFPPKKIADRFEYESVIMSSTESSRVVEGFDTATNQLVAIKFTSLELWKRERTVYRALSFHGKTGKFMLECDFTRTHLELIVAVQTDLPNCCIARS
jgi:hypothetical protein